MKGLISVLILLCSGIVLAQDHPIAVDGWILQDAVRVAGDGAQVSSRQFKTDGWTEAVVPGTVLTSLVKAGVYKEPLYGLNNLSIPESLCRTSYWYRTATTVPRSFKGKRVWLQFDGINYIAEIWVNGKRQGTIEGAFARGVFDITDAVSAGGSAVIAVKIDPPPHPGKPHEQSLAAGVGPNGGILGADNPTFHATIGWDWIPGIRDRNMGLWQGVSLYATGPVVIRDPYVKVGLALPKTDKATLDIEATVQNTSGVEQRGELVGTILGTDLKFRVPVKVHPGLTTTSIPTLSLNNPKLWWPNGYGEQNLYKLNLTLKIGNAISSEKTVTFGVRTIDYFPKDGKNLTIIVNGVPVLCKGGNWGLDEAMKRSPLKRLDAQIRLHRDANVTMIRNWVGQSTQEDFYALCDKNGILVWDDFWLANPYDGPDPYNNERFLANSLEKVVRFRNHPSIAVWCGRNEGMPPKVLDDGLRAIVANNDGKRFYQSHSAEGNGVSGYGPYGYQNPAQYFKFWDGMHSEIGVPSIPTLEAVKAMMPKKDWWPINDDWAYHDLCKGASAGDRYPSMLAERFGEVRGLEDFVRKGQMVNYESHRAIYEGRNSRLFNPATGVLIWMSNPAQPSFVWQLYSYDLEPNASLFGTKKACELVHVQLEPWEGKVQVINNGASLLAGLSATATVYDLAGNKLSSETKKVDAPPSAATDAWTIKWPEVLPEVHFVKLMLKDAKGRTLSDNFYWRNGTKDSSGKPSDKYPGLDSLPLVTLDASATAKVRGDKVWVTVKLSNPTKTVALLAHIQLRKAKSGARVLPVFYSDNYVSLLPGESRTLKAEVSASDLGGDEPLIAVDGWNVTIRVSKTTGGIRFEPNHDMTR